MFRKGISPNDLEVIALRELRKLPCGAYITNLQIYPRSEDWAIRCMIRSDANPQVVKLAVERVTKLLKRRYRLKVLDQL